MAMGAGHESWPWGLESSNCGHGSYIFLELLVVVTSGFFSSIYPKYRISCEHKVFIQFITSDCIMMGDGKCKLVVHSFEELCDLRFSIPCPVDLNPDSNLLVY